MSQTAVQMQIAALIIAVILPNMPATQSWRGASGLRLTHPKNCGELQEEGWSQRPS